jgi:uncharacterized protein YjbI with pentapeptide repeats
MTSETIAEDLAAHKLWLDTDKKEGTRINWSGKDLAWANLAYADLAEANLTRADLAGANLAVADLRVANLTGANLAGANLTEADFRGTDLTGANLYKANLAYANLAGANLTEAILPGFQLCPQSGTFTAYKKVRDLNGKGVVLELEVLGDRTSSLIGRTCRTSKARVIKAINSSETEFVSTHDKNFRYTVGAEIECKDYNGDIRVECTSGIHFFITQEEAKGYNN